MRHARIALLAVAAFGILVAAVRPDGSQATAQAHQSADAAARPPVVVVHITSGPDTLFPVVDGLRLAADARQLNRRVIVQFSGAGARVPARSLPHELRLNDEPPLRQMLLDLRDAGAEFIVCDFSARALGIHDGEFIDGTFIAHSHEALLRRMGTNAVVFTY